MHNLFSPDSKFSIVMGRVGDLLLLNFFFLFTSLPIITIGASTTALYAVCFRFDTGRDFGTTRSYFRAFRDNFKKATLLWLPILLVGAALVANIYFFASLPGKLSYVCVLFLILLLLDVFVFSYAFPLQSQFENTTKKTFKNALVLSIGYLPRTLLLAAVNLLPWLLMLLNFWVFLKMAFLWVVLYFAIAAYLGTFLLKRVFEPYMPKEEEEK